MQHDRPMLRTILIVVDDDGLAARLSDHLRQADSPWTASPPPARPSPEWSRTPDRSCSICENTTATGWNSWTRGGPGREDPGDRPRRTGRSRIHLGLHPARGRVLRRPQEPSLDLLDAMVRQTLSSLDRERECAEANARLQEQRRFFQAVLDALPHPLHVIDVEQARSRLPIALPRERHPAHRDSTRGRTGQPPIRR